MYLRKQIIFDAFADKSIAAQKSLEINNNSFDEIIESEIDRINKKRGISIETENSGNNEAYYGSLMKMNYEELVNHLLNKYGKCQYDYFLIETCKSKNSRYYVVKKDLFATISIKTRQ